MKYSEKELARLVQAMESNNFAYCIGFFRSMERAFGSKIIRKYQSAVERLEQIFEQMFGVSAWPPDWPPDAVVNARIKLAGYVSAFGNIAPLIDDLQQLQNEGRRPNNMKYLIYAKNAASRWELLVDRHLEAEWLKRKAAEATAFKRTSDVPAAKKRVEFMGKRQQPKSEVLLSSLFSGLMK